MTKLVLAITKGLLRDHVTRRKTMFGIVLAALVMLFCGATFLNAWLTERPRLFLAYWAVVAWLTFTTILLALYDMLVVRTAARQERRELRRRIFGENDPDV